MLQETRSVSQIAAEYQIDPRLLHRWRREVVDHLADFFADPVATASAAKAQEQQVQDLYAQIGKLTTQLAWIKKSWPRP